jgi:hypothetical protein
MKTRTREEGNRWIRRRRGGRDEVRRDGERYGEK